VAQNVYKNKNLQGEFSDPDSPYYQGDGTGTDENGQPIGNCVEINAGCTAGKEEIEDYIGDEIIIIGSSGESLYYYHPDHLGSASVITDGSGNLREHTEYFAFGETWVQEGASKKTPFMYTGKELDQETGLYYYGARYYDPRTSVWQSVDPILEKYMPDLDDRLAAVKQGKDYFPEQSLPGMGGVYNPMNLAGYTYSHNNPVKYVDPDGNEVYGLKAYEKLSTNQRQAIIQVNNVSPLELQKFGDFVKELGTTSKGASILREAVPAYENLSDMAIFAKAAGSHYIKSASDSSLYGMIQHDGQSGVIDGVENILLAATPIPRKSGIPGFSKVESYVNLANSLKNFIGDSPDRIAELLTFYGSQVE